VLTLCLSLSPFWPAAVQAYAALLEPMACYAEIPPDFLAAILWSESRADPLAIGPAGEIGLMQIYYDYTRPNQRALADPLVNLAYAVYLLRGCQAQVDSLYDLARCYNQGRPTETGSHGYARQIMAAYTQALAARWTPPEQRAWPV